MVNRCRGKLEEKRLALVITRYIIFYSLYDSGDSSNAGVSSISCFKNSRIINSLYYLINKAETSPLIEAPTCSRLAALSITGCRLALYY